MPALFRHTSSFGRRPIRQRALAAFGAVAACLPSVWFTGADQASAAGERPHEVATLPLYVPPGAAGPSGDGAASLVINPISRRGYQLTRFSVSPGPGLPVQTTRITSFDLDSLRVLRTVETAGMLYGSHHEVDAAGGRVFFRHLARDFDFAGIVVLDEPRFDAGSPTALTYLARPPRPEYTTPPVSFRYEPSTKRLIGLFNTDRATEIGMTAKPLYLNSVAQWDPASTTAGAIKEDWLHPLVRSCNSGTLTSFIRSHPVPFVSGDGRTLYVPCGTSDYAVNLVRLAIGAPGNAPGAEEATPGIGGVRRMVVDVQAERVHFVAGGAYATTYDGVAMRLVGTSVLSSAVQSTDIASGMDPTTGRVYFDVPPSGAVQGEVPERGGLLTVEGRRPSMPQALAYRDLATGRGLSDAVIPVDPQTPDRPTRLFLGRYVNGTISWRVVADPLPVSAPPMAASEPTTGVDEAPGKTERAYAGEASGYGLRYLAIGGLSNASLLLFAARTSCLPRGREIVAGQVDRSGLSSLAATAEAHAVQADDGTQADARDASRCWPVPPSTYPRLVDDPPPPQALRGAPGASGWTESKAECAGKEHADAVVEGGTAEVDCKQDGEHVAARAVHSGLGVAGVTVGRSTSRTTLRRVEKDGLVVETESTAEGIRVEVTPTSTITIDRVRSVATARSRGRIGGDYQRAEWRVELCGVRAPGIDEQGCRSGSDAASVVDALNQAGRGRLIFRQPRVNPELFRGTPKGYLAGVERDVGEMSLARVELGDDHRGVAGLEIHVRHAVGEPPANRAVFQLAGVRAVAAYGVYELLSLIRSDEQDEEQALPLPEGAELVEASEDQLATFEQGLPPLPDAPQPAQAARAARAGGLVAEGIRRLAKAVAVGADIFFRGPFESLVLFGIWSTFGLPVYLFARRRMGVAA